MGEVHEICCCFYPFHGFSNGYFSWVKVPSSIYIELETNPYRFSIGKVTATTSESSILNASCIVSFRSFLLSDAVDRRHSLTKCECNHWTAMLSIPHFGCCLYSYRSCQTYRYRIFESWIGHVRAHTPRWRAGKGAADPNAAIAVCRFLVMVVLAAIAYFLSGAMSK